MQYRFSRTGGTLALGAILALAGAQASTAQSSVRETTLLRITLLKNSYRDVLRLYGRPDEIQAGGPYVPSESGSPAAKSSGRSPMMGGMMMGGPPGSAGYPGMSGGPGLPGMAGAGMSGTGGPGGGKKSTSKTGFPGKGGTGTSAPGGPGMAGMGGGPPGSAGYPGMAGAVGGGLPGFAGSAGSPGAGGYPGMGGEGPAMGGTSGMVGSGGASGGAEANADQPEYEATWWYHDRKNGLHKSFLFNKDGRVIQVQEYGYDPHHIGSKTKKGVALGSGLNAVLRSYGWSNDGANDGKNLIMRFGGEDKVAFQLVNNKVVGITIAVVKDIAPAEAP